MGLLSTHPTTGIKSAAEVSYGITHALGLQKPSDYKVVSFVNGIFTRVISTTVSIGPFLVLNRDKITPFLTTKNIVVAGYDLVENATYAFKYATSLSSKLPSLPFTVPSLPFTVPSIPLKYVTLPYRVLFASGYNALHSIGYFGHSIVKFCKHDKYAAKASLIRGIAFAIFSATTCATFYYCRNEKVWTYATIAEGSLNLLFPNQLRKGFKKVTAVFDSLFLVKAAKPKPPEYDHKKTIKEKTKAAGSAMEKLTSSIVPPVTAASDSPSSRTRSKTGPADRDDASVVSSVESSARKRVAPSETDKSEGTPAPSQAEKDAAKKKKEGVPAPKDDTDDSRSIASVDTNPEKKDK